MRGKIVQRVRIEAGETYSLLQLFDNFDPLPSRMLKEGFRDELRFTIVDDHYLLNGMLVRAYVGWDMLAVASADLGNRLSFLGGKSLQCSIVFDEWTDENIIRTLGLAKAFAKVASQLAIKSKEGVPHIQMEIAGLLNAAFEFMMEDVEARKQGSAKLKKNDQLQGKLFEE